jgi:hypothetical protein
MTGDTKRKQMHYTIEYLQQKKELFSNKHIDSRDKKEEHILSPSAIRSDNYQIR